VSTDREVRQPRRCQPFPQVIAMNASSSPFLKTYPPLVALLLLAGPLAREAAAQGFAPDKIVIGLAGGRSTVAIDMDGDGDQDVLSGGDDTVVWFENLHGAGGFGPPIEITTVVDNVYGVFAADLDGDGDPDVLSASSEDDKIAWYENLDGLGAFGPQRIISTDAQTARSVFAADLDGDGDRDVLSASWNDSKVAWYENTDGAGTFGPQRVITTALMWATPVVAADLDGDGDQDVVAGSGFSNGGEVAWCENTDGLGTFGAPRTITTELGPVESICAADLDGDGDQDVLSASGFLYPSEPGRIAWYENTDGLGTFGAPRILSADVSHGYAVFAADLDGDGDRDVLAGTGYAPLISGDPVPFHWYENTDGHGSFGPQQTVSADDANVFTVCAADLDGDGDLDAIAGTAWYENLAIEPPEVVAFDAQELISTAEDDPRAVVAADIDGDGDLDVLSAHQSDKLAWHENTGGLHLAWPERIVSFTTDGATTVVAADLDGDGDQDVLAGGLGGEVAWYENLAGTGAFGPQQLLFSGPDYVYSVFAADLDGDGDQDALSAATYGVVHRLAWYENVDGLGAFGPQQVISTDVQDVRSVFAADLDGDGDRDVLSARVGAVDEVAWYENLDGLGTFGPPSVISVAASSPSAVVAADLDGDGDLDVLYAAEPIAWHANLDGLGTFGPAQVISAVLPSPRSVVASDLDDDGDLDVVSASSFSLEPRFVYYLNQDGQGAFGPEQLITTEAPATRSVFAADLDDDGDPDVLSASDSAGAGAQEKIAWYENLRYVRAVVQPYGCGTNPEGSLSMVSGLPTIGTTFALGVDNPLGTQGPSAALLGVAMTPAPSFPCGWNVPGLGMAGPGADGEILVGWFYPPFLVISGPAWSTPGTPAVFSYDVPVRLELVGLRLYFQGLLWDQAPGAPVPIGLTDGLVLRFGS